MPTLLLPMMFLQLVLVLALFVIPIRLLVKGAGSGMKALQDFLKACIILLVLGAGNALIGLVLSIPTDAGRIYFFFTTIFSCLLFLWFTLGRGAVWFILEDSYDKPLYEKLILLNDLDFSFFDYLQQKRTIRVALTTIAIFFGLLIVLYLAPKAFSPVMPEASSQPSIRQSIEAPESSIGTVVPLPADKEPDARGQVSAEWRSIEEVSSRIAKLKIALELTELQRVLVSIEDAYFDEAGQRILAQERDQNERTLRSRRAGSGVVFFLFPYVVKAGETEWAIARRFGLEQQDLHIPDGHLRAEEKIYVPYQARLKNHKVEAGETLYSIARTYRIWIDQLKWLNGFQQIEDPALKVGDRLIVFDGLEKRFSRSE